MTGFGKTQFIIELSAVLRTNKRLQVQLIIKLVSVVLLINFTPFKSLELMKLGGVNRCEVFVCM